MSTSFNGVLVQALETPLDEAAAATRTGRLRRLELVDDLAFTPELPPELQAVRSTPPTRSSRSARASVRALDVFGAAFGLLILSPVFFLLVAGIRLTSNGPALFRQQRVGRDGRMFSCLKFRSMYADADERLAELLAHPERRAQWEGFQKLFDDPRITPLGRYLRRFDLDELPQLWNVFRGEMSLVGPRPVLEPETERYGSALPTVLSVKPGMTGLWQISGRNTLTYDQRVSLDTCYVMLQSAALNLAIIVRTLWLITIRRNGSI